jgi:hypothetical protein
MKPRDVSSNAQKNRVNKRIMTTSEKLKDYSENLKYSMISRMIADNELTYKKGFVVDYSDKFILFKEVEDFVVRGFLIFPIEHISKIRRNKNDIFFEKICKLEGITKSINNKPNVNLSSWQTIFKSIHKLGFNVIIRNEEPDDDTFDIGPIIKVTSKKVFINYFDATGKLDLELTEIPFEKITLVDFDDIYTNTISKYLKIKSK